MVLFISEDTFLYNTDLLVSYEMRIKSVIV